MLGLVLLPDPPGVIQGILGFVLVFQVWDPDRPRAELFAGEGWMRRSALTGGGGPLGPLSDWSNKGGV